MLPLQQLFKKFLVNIQINDDLVLDCQAGCHPLDKIWIRPASHVGKMLNNMCAFLNAGNSQVHITTSFISRLARNSAWVMTVVALWSLTKLHKGRKDRTMPKNDKWLFHLWKVTPQNVFKWKCMAVAFIWAKITNESKSSYKRHEPKKQMRQKNATKWWTFVSANVILSKYVLKKIERPQKKVGTQEMRTFFFCAATCWNSVFCVSVFSFFKSSC